MSATAGNCFSVYDLVICMCMNGRKPLCLYIFVYGCECGCRGAWVYMWMRGNCVGGCIGGCVGVGVDQMCV